METFNFRHPRQTECAQCFQMKNEDRTVTVCGTVIWKHLYSVNFSLSATTSSEGGGQHCGTKNGLGAPITWRIECSMALWLNIIISAVIGSLVIFAHFKRIVCKKCEKCAKENVPKKRSKRKEISPPNPSKIIRENSHKITFCCFK